MGYRSPTNRFWLCGNGLRHSMTRSWFEYHASEGSCPVEFEGEAYPLNVSSTSWEWSVILRHFSQKSKYCPIIDSKQVPWGKIEKNSEWRIKKPEINLAEADYVAYCLRPRYEFLALRISGPSWNTDQGVSHYRECNSIKLDAKRNQ